MSGKMTKAQAGRLGGKATAAKHGRKYMQELGRRGALSFWARYKLTPANLNNYAIVCRETGKTIGFTNGGL